jgi:peptide/nickel transport system substrate-binding protein
MSDSKDVFAVKRESVSRREVMLGATATGLSTIIAGGMSSKAKAQTPKKGGRLRMAVPGGATTDVLDPGTWNDIYMQTVGFGPMRNNLAEVSPDNEVIPELAESWEPSRDAKNWTFKLRKGVEFHSGKTLTASDVLASINHHRGRNNTSIANALARAIEEVKLEDSTTISFSLNQGNADFPALMTDFRFGIMPADAEGKVDWRSGDGTGGYVMSTFDPGVRALLKRFPNYWKSGTAHFDEVEVLSINDITARQNAIITGAVDVADRIDLKTVDLIRRNGKIVIENVPGKLYYTFEMLTTVEPFRDANLRLAMKHAIDREALLSTVLRGFGSLGNDHPLSKAYRYFDPSIPQRQYDADKAKFYLQKAGHSSFSIDLNISDVAFNGATDASALFREQAAKANININLIREASDGYFQRTLGKVPLMATYFTGRPTEDGILSIAFGLNSASNNPKWASPEVNSLIESARSEIDVAKRKETYSGIQRRIRDEGASLITLFANYVFARSGKLAHGPMLSSDRSLDGAKMCERWWFA